MTSSATETAEGRFREAFTRLKEGKAVVMPRGTPVSQNNVAKEAGTDPTALKKKRYPALIREIQAYVEIACHEKAAQDVRRVRRKQRREDLKAEVKTAEAQRDSAQAKLLSAERRLLELLQENAAFRARLDDLLPAPTPLRR